MHSPRRLLLVASALVAAGAIGMTLLWRAGRGRPSPVPPASAPPETSRESAAFRPPGPPGQPHIEISADHQLERVQHKDASGLSPLELVQTPQGLVTIQRTFRSSGRLLKQEAFLEGKPVAVPRK